MRRRITQVLPAVVLVLWLGAPSPAAERKGAKARQPGRDSIDAAFRVPKGITLSAEQQAKLDKLKAEYRPKLQKASRRLRAAASDDEKAEARTELAELKEEVRQLILALLTDKQRAQLRGEARKDPKKKSADRKADRARAAKGPNAKANPRRPHKPAARKKPATGRKKSARRNAARARSNRKAAARRAAKNAGNKAARSRSGKAGAAKKPQRPGAQAPRKGAVRPQPRRSIPPRAIPRRPITNRRFQGPRAGGQLPRARVTPAPKR